MSDECWKQQKNQSETVSLSSAGFNSDVNAHKEKQMHDKNWEDQVIYIKPNDVESLFVFTVKTKFSCSCLCFMNHCVVALRMSQRAIWPTPLLATLSNRPPTRNRWETSNTYGFIQLWFSIFRVVCSAAQSWSKYFINMLMQSSYTTWCPLILCWFQILLQT